MRHSLSIAAACATALAVASPVRAAKMAPEACDDEQVILTLVALAARDNEMPAVSFADARTVSEDGAVLDCEVAYETPDGRSGTVRYTVQTFAPRADENAFFSVPLAEGILNFQGEGFAVSAQWLDGTET